MPRPKHIFISYAHEDTIHRERLETVLRPLRDAGKIDLWHDRKLIPGDDWIGKIDEHLAQADLILLLVSRPFRDSAYIRDVEMRLAVDRHAAGLATVVPIIVDDIDWTSAPFNRTQALPEDAKAVTSWTDTGAAWADVDAGIRRLIDAPPRPLEPLPLFLQRHAASIALTMIGWALAFILTGLGGTAGLRGGWRWALVGVLGATVMGETIRRSSRAANRTTVALLIVSFTVCLSVFWPVAGQAAGRPAMGPKGMIGQILAGNIPLDDPRLWFGVACWTVAGVLAAIVLWSNYRTRWLLGDHSRPAVALLVMAAAWGAGWLLLGLTGMAEVFSRLPERAMDLIAGLIVGGIGGVGTYVALWTFERPVSPRQL